MALIAAPQGPGNWWN